uniref:dUTPase-like domain-containing protein n=1 Tax=Macaca fascicularis TaxID=9541 RepID=A0A7N9CFR0_MACFA
MFVSCSHDITFCWPRSLSSRGRNAATRRHNNHSISWKLRLPRGHYGLLLPLSQQAKEGVTVLAGVIDLNYQDEISLLLHSRGKEEYAWNTGDPLGRSLVLPCPVIKVNGKLQQPNPGRTKNGPDPSGMKVWVTLPGRKPQRAEVLAEGKGNAEWVVEEGSHQYQLQPHDQLQKRGL